MSNTGVTLLIGLAIILTIAIVILLTSAAIEDFHNQGVTGTTGPSSLPPCSADINLSSLLQIPNSGANCLQNGVTGPLFYIGNLSGSKYDYVVAPWGTQPLDVCVGFCSHFNGTGCSGPNFNGQSAQANFDNCLTQLSSTTCSPPIPIAARGTILYYAFSPTCSICDNCATQLISL